MDDAPIISESKKVSRRETDMRPMNCPTKSGDIEILLDFAAGRLDAAEVYRVDGHISACPECARVVSAQRAVWSAMEDFRAIPVSPDFNQRLYARIAAEQVQGRSWQQALRALGDRLWFVDWRPLVPASAAVAVLAIALIVQAPGASHQKSVAPDTQNRIEKSDLDQIERALDDLDMLNTLGDGGTKPAL